MIPWKQIIENLLTEMVDVEIAVHASTSTGIVNDLHSGALRSPRVDVGLRLLALHKQRHPVEHQAITTAWQARRTAL